MESKMEMSWAVSKLRKMGCSNQNEFQKFGEKKIFEIASDYCATVETEALRTRMKDISGR
jgi:DNA-binding transcriptional regulator GbsR (MarR family)